LSLVRPSAREAETVAQEAQAEGAAAREAKLEDGSREARAAYLKPAKVEAQEAKLEPAKRGARAEVAVLGPQPAERRARDRRFRPRKSQASQCCGPAALLVVAAAAASPEVPRQEEELRLSRAWTAGQALPHRKRRRP
jgi:hypothetical protein